MRVFQEVERELSFLGGSGLYYHYYKQMLAAASFSRGTCRSALRVKLNICRCDPLPLVFLGFYELAADNTTISGQTINAVERLFLYPELITSFIYRVTGSQVRSSSASSSPLLLSCSPDYELIHSVVCLFVSSMIH